MDITDRRATWILAGALLGLAPALPAFAHGDQTHAAAGPVRKEQKDWGIAAESRQARSSPSEGRAQAQKSQTGARQLHHPQE